jgi:hypothetical protein
VCKQSSNVIGIGAATATHKEFNWFREYFGRWVFQSGSALVLDVHPFDGLSAPAGLQTEMEFLDDIICVSRRVNGRHAKA